MFNLSFFEQWFNHIIGWPILLVVLLTLLYLRVNWKVATMMVPVALAALAFLMIDLERTLGRPYKSMPVGKWMYVHHIVKKDTIDLFIVDKLGSRLYTINNTSEDRKKLEKTKQRTKQGIPQEGEFKKHNKISKGTELEHELVIRNLPVAKHIIKE